MKMMLRHGKKTKRNGSERAAAVSNEHFQTTVKKGEKKHRRPDIHYLTKDSDQPRC